jgi:hypothetical protein
MQPFLVLVLPGLRQSMGLIIVPDAGQKLALLLNINLASNVPLVNIEQFREH